MRRAPISVSLLLLTFGCGAATPTAREPDETSGGATVVRPVADEVDPQLCATDADCMIGTPRDCCTSFCPADRLAWSRSAWADYQAECAVEECATSESLACLDRDLPPVVAACQAERCVLVGG